MPAYSQHSRFFHHLSFHAHFYYTPFIFHTIHFPHHSSSSPFFFSTPSFLTSLFLHHFVFLNIFSRHLSFHANFSCIIFYHTISSSHHLFCHTIFLDTIIFFSHYLLFHIVSLFTPSFLTPSFHAIHSTRSSLITPPLFSHHIFPMLLSLCVNPLYYFHHPLACHLAR